MTNAIQSAFDQISKGTDDVLKNGLNAKPSNVFSAAGDFFGAASKRAEATNPVLEAVGQGVVGYFTGGNPYAAAAVAGSNARERGENWGDTAKKSALAGAIAYGASSAGSASSGSDVGGGVDQYGNPINGTSNFQGGGPDTTDYGNTQTTLGNTGAPSVTTAPDPNAPDLNNDMPTVKQAGESPANTTTTPSKAVEPAKEPEGTISKTLKQVGTTAAVSSILAGSKPGQPSQPNAPAPTVAPVTAMPDPLAQEQAKRRALVEQIMRRGRTSTILTDSGGY